MPSEHPTRVAGRRVRGIGLAVTVVVLIVVAMIAAGIQGAPTFRPSDPVPPPTSEPLPTTAPGGTGTPEPLENESTNAVLVQVMGIVLMVLVAAAVLALLVLIVRALLRAWRERPLRRRDAADVAHGVDDLSVAPDPEVAVTVIQRGIAGALLALDDRMAPTDAIVAAWVGLEESAADAGVSRAASETAGEFALRIITLRSGIADDAVALLNLYERVRFGTYVAVEQDRVAARAALRRIEEVWR